MEKYEKIHKIHLVQQFYPIQISNSCHLRVDGHQDLQIFQKFISTKTFRIYFIYTKSTKERFIRITLEILTNFSMEKAVRLSFQKV